MDGPCKLTPTTVARLASVFARAAGRCGADGPGLKHLYLDVVAAELASSSETEGEAVVDRRARNILGLIGGKMTTPEDHCQNSFRRGRR